MPGALGAVMLGRGAGAFPSVRPDQGEDAGPSRLTLFPAAMITV
jgi:hypothetical protein